MFVIGEDEAANGTVLVKNMAAREQQIFKRDDIQGMISAVSGAKE